MTTSKGPQKKKRRTTTAARQKNMSSNRLPARTYRNSLVPLRSGGYTPNRVEKKVFDLAVATYNVSTTVNNFVLFNPRLGTDFTNRIGRKAVAKSLYLRGYIAREAALASPIVGANLPADIARLILFWDLQSNGTNPGITDLLVSNHVASHLNMDNRDRFKVLRDEIFVFDAFLYSAVATQSYAFSGKNIHEVKHYVKLNQEVIWNQVNGGTVADIQTGTLCMMIMGTQPSGASTDISANLSSRVRFVDS